MSEFPLGHKKTLEIWHAQKEAMRIVHNHSGIPLGTMYNFLEELGFKSRSLNSIAVLGLVNEKYLNLSTEWRLDYA